MKSNPGIVPMIFLVLSGCGSSSQSYLGTWQESGLLTASIPGSPFTSSLAITATTHISSGSSGALVIARDGSTCAIPGKISGDKVTLQPGYQCSDTSTGTTVSLTLAQGTVDLIDPNTLHENATGSLSSQISGQPLAGGFSYAATLTRQSAQ